MYFQEKSLTILKLKKYNIIILKLIKFVNAVMLYRIVVCHRNLDEEAYFVCLSKIRGDAIMMQSLLDGDKIDEVIVSRIDASMSTVQK